MAARKLTTAEAATVLRLPESEVASVRGNVAVTAGDGQRYRLTGEQPGDYVWLKADGSVPVPANEDDA